MLPRAHRLTKNDLRCFTGRRLVTPTLHLIVRPSPAPRSRLAIVIPKGVMPKAHDRNRLKRIMAHASRPQLTAPPHQDLLLIIKPLAARRPETQVLTDLHHLLAQIKLPIQNRSIQNSHQ